MTTSRASAVWEGKLKDGRGEFRSASGSFAAPYSFRTRFEGAPGATPEELIAAAQAACLAMALSANLEKAGTPATQIAAEAACTIEPVGGVSTITTLAISVRGKVAGLDQAGFVKAAETAGETCPVARALKGNVRISIQATLEP
jgi:osmotically inducible protein OsmC